MTSKMRWPRCCLIRAHGPAGENLLNLGKFPFLVAKRTCRPSLQPSLDAVQMEDMTTDTPCNAEARMFCIPCWICLQFVNRNDIGSIQPD